MRDQGIKSEPNENKRAKHTYAQGEGVDHQLTIAKRAQSTSATALQWQVHVRRYPCKSKCDLSSMQKQRTAPTPQDEARGGSERELRAKTKGDVHGHAEVHVLSRNKSRRTRRASETWIVQVKTQGAKVREKSRQANDRGRQRNSWRCIRESLSGKEAKLKGSRSHRTKEVADASPSRRDVELAMSWAISRTVPDDTPYSCSGLVMESPKSSEGSARL